jgi:flagellar capping protein FliD
VSENILETIRSTVQDFLAPELKTQGVRLDGIEKRLDDSRHSLEQRIDDSKDLLRAEMRALDARMNTLESLIRSLTQQVTMESSLREPVASLEASVPKQ